VARRIVRIDWDNRFKIPQVSKNRYALTFRRNTPASATRPDRKMSREVGSGVVVTTPGMISIEKSTVQNGQALPFDRLGRR
jgi:hypothetical protein